MAMWAFYAVFASLASNAQGEKITMGFEAVAMFIVGVVALLSTTAADWQSVTTLSASQASTMGMLSAGGLFIQLYCLRIAPIDKQGTVIMITCMFPVFAVVIFDLMSRLGFSGGSVATPRQWAGVVTGAIALWLISK